MRTFRNILNSISRYIHGDRYSFIAITAVLLVLCASTVLGFIILSRNLPNLVGTVSSFVRAVQSPTSVRAVQSPASLRATQPPTPIRATQSPTSVHTIQPLTPATYRDCNEGKPYSGTWASGLEDMSFEAYLCPDGTLIAVFHNQEIPESIKINQKPRNQLEFSWGVSVNVDSKMTTGSPAGYFEGIMGAEYRILLAHWSLGSEETVPFAEAYQVNVWQFTDDGFSEVISDAGEFIDGQDGLLVLRGFIPGMSSKSKVLFSRFNYSIYHELTYKTNWVKSEQ